MSAVRYLALVLALASLTAQGQPFKLAPAVATEAEGFTIDSGWTVLKNGNGNYMVDIIGFCHLSGERLLHLPPDKAGKAHLDLEVPQEGTYRLWVRYEYPPHCDTSFKVVIEQDGKALLSQEMGKRDSLRWGLGGREPLAQHDPSWGPEGLMDESVTVRGLKKGKARITLQGEKLPDRPGVSAARNIDLIYLTRDEADSWMPHYRKRANLYPLLEAFRDTLGPRWEVKVHNKGGDGKGKGAATPRVRHVYNRIPWGMSEPAAFPAVAAGKDTPWVGLLGQDTTHFSMIEFTLAGCDLEVELRPAGGGKAHRFGGKGVVRVYVPPYPGRGEEPTTPEAAISRILTALEKAKAPGKKPTQPLCYGGWMPLGSTDEYGKKYAQLYAALGFRSLHPAHSGPRVMENLKEAGVSPTKSWMVMGYRNPPTQDNVLKARAEVGRRGMADHLRFFDYGDEIHFSEWLTMMANEDVAANKRAGTPITAAQAINARWARWLQRQKDREKLQLKDYWLPAWGPIKASGLRPDSSALAAQLSPRLYIDSLRFYEEEAIAFAAAGMRAVKKELGEDVLCGANYSCHPFYYPSSTMYIQWLRGGAADMCRHSEYFWQVAQPGPMVNGYIAEHFRAGLRDNPKGVIRQYTMPHAPGNTDASFLRSCFTHLAHGAGMLDFFGIGMNESFTENHIDHRAVSRFVAMRDVTHSVGLIEDLLPEAKPMPSQVALLVSESTERWDMAGIARDRAGHDLFGKEFRKARLHYHLERLGLWKAFTFAGSTPDLVTEEDVLQGKLGKARLLVLVGDHWKAGLIPAVEAWVKDGGVVLSTAGAGAHDEYGQPLKGAWEKVAGVKPLGIKVTDTFFRPRQELPFLKPIHEVQGDGWKMPALAVASITEPEEGTEVLARAGKPAAVTMRKLGKGAVLHVGALPGVAYLWSALQPPIVPDRGAGTHSVPTKFDEGAAALVQAALKAANVPPDIKAEPRLIDARLLVARGGMALPLASYTGQSKEKVTLTVAVPRQPKKVASAAHGDLEFSYDKGAVTFTLPALSYGDIVRMD
jgi:hypothetical protein